MYLNKSHTALKYSFMSIVKQRLETNICNFLKHSLYYENLYLSGFHTLIKSYLHNVHIVCVNMAAPMPHISGLRLLICVLLLTLSTLTSCEEYDFDAAPYPGLQHDLRFELPAGDTQCFFQKIKQGATLYTSFEVNIINFYQMIY